MQQDNLFTEQAQTEKPTGPVTCLGKTFTNDAERRAYFTALLAEKLKDPEFRKIEGFPIGSDEDILNLSDAPYYTACPNPWIADFIAQWQEEKRHKYIVNEYYKEPLDSDIEASRNNRFVNSHSYATKTPHQAIMRLILHYTSPGDVVLDMFSGTGMTAIAAQLCGNPEVDFKRSLEDKSTEIQWGERNVIVGDLGIAPTFISSNLNFTDYEEDFLDDVKCISEAIESELGWMYKTQNDYGELVNITAILWSDVYLCFNCNKEFSYWDAAVNEDEGKIDSSIVCPECGAIHSKNNLVKSWESFHDDVLGTTLKRVKSKPETIIYDLGGKRFEKLPDDYDLEILKRINEYKIPFPIPTREMPKGFNTEQPKKSHGLTHVHHFFTKRNLACLACAWSVAKSKRAKFLITSLMYKSSLLCAPLMSNYFAEKKGNARGGWIGKERSGTLYCPAIHSEVMLQPQISSRAKSVFVFAESSIKPVITTQSATSINIPNESIDYIFTDPPFGANRMYSELNFIWEAWLGITTSSNSEAIENPAVGKDLDFYRELMSTCFREYYRVLKPGRWITVEFSNTKAVVWNTLQTVLGDSGFVVAAVNGLDKLQGSIEAYTSSIAVTKDLVISAYKPHEEFEKRFIREAETEEGVWSFIRTHLEHLPICRIRENVLHPVFERDARLLFDKVVAYYVRKGFHIPLSSNEFQIGLAQRFIERDGMYFLDEQAAEFDKNKTICTELFQSSLFVKDEVTAIQWLRHFLKNKPGIFSEINPEFLLQKSGWSKNEIQLDLRELLKDNFLCYDGKDEVPDQIHSYLSTNWKELRNLAKTAPELNAKAKDRWYVPDPNKAGDLEKLRERSLLKEFEEYKTAKKKLKVFRIEAVRAGFKKLWETQEFASILEISTKLPNDVIAEDPILLMYYDQAMTLSQNNSNEDW